MRSIAENPTSSGRESFSSGVVRETLDHERARSEVSGVGNAQGALELTPRPIPKNTQPKLAFPGVLDGVSTVEALSARCPRLGARFLSTLQHQVSRSHVRTNEWNGTVPAVIASLLLVVLRVVVLRLFRMPRCSTL